MLLLQTIEPLIVNHLRVGWVPEAKMLTSYARGADGRWLKGASPNPAGRPKGSRNKAPRRRADTAHAADWSSYDWKIYFLRIMKQAPPSTLHMAPAAFADCVAL